VVGEGNDGREIFSGMGGGRGGSIRSDDDWVERDGIAGREEGDSAEGGVELPTSVVDILLSAPCRGGVGTGEISTRLVLSSKPS
jgi:hypothetical protein